MRRLLILFGSAAAALAAVIYAPVSLAPGQNPPAEERIAEPYLEIGNADIFVEIARDPAAVQKGLSGRASLAPERGMLFIFPKPDYYRFWMPDMHFPIDIIWIADGKVAGITKNVSPEFDPSNPHFYLPPVAVRYVLEVNAGFSEMHGIAAGDPVTFHKIAF